MFNPQNGLHLDEEALARRSVVSPSMRGNVFVSLGPARRASCWRVGATKKGMARLSVESLRLAMSQRK